MYHSGMSISIIRSCSRCGKDFHSTKRELICGECKKKHGENKEPTFREWQIIDRVRRALPNKEIAFELHLSEGTIKEYMNRIFRKLDMSSRTELAVWAATHQDRMYSSLGKRARNTD